jgi:hypothetical protein
MSSTPYRSTRLHEITGLGRPIDLKMGSNQLAIIGTVVAGLVAIVLAWFGATDLGFTDAASVAAGTFLAWALVREIDPGNDRAAAIAMAIAGGIGLIAPPAALVVGVLLLTVRILAGTVGSDLRSVDLVVLTSAAAYAGTQPVAWPIVVLLAYAVLRSGHRWRIPTAVAMGIAASAAAFFFVTDLAPGLNGAGTWVLLSVLALASWRSIRRPLINAPADDGSPIRSSGVGLARLSTFTAIVAGTVLSPETALADLGPAVAALASVALWPRLADTSAQGLDQSVRRREAAGPRAV